MNKECKSFQLFIGGINAKTTASPYTYSLDEFMRFCKLDDYAILASKDTDTIQDLLERWILSLKRKNLRVTTIHGKLNGVELFLDMNKKIWYKKIIRKLVGKEGEIPGGNLPYTNEELFRLRKCARKPRDVFMIDFFASTGTRPASLIDPVLRIKHIVDMSHDCKAIKIYDGSKEGYWAFFTPETTRSWNDYLKSRKLNGEVITPESPVFANYQHESRTKNQHMSTYSIREILDRLCKLALIERKKIGNRYDKAIVYGFRKRFNGILKMNNNVNSNIAEKLMAHKRGLDGVYLQPTRDECFREFVKAISELTIDPTERKNQEIEAKDKEISQLGSEKETIEHFESILKQMQESERKIAQYRKEAEDGLEIQREAVEILRKNKK